MTTLKPNSIEPATPKHQDLDVFVGVWQTTGIILQGDATGQHIDGTDRYEWMEGGFFLLHHVDVVMGNQRAKALEIFSLHENRQYFTAHGFDNAGNASVYKLQNRQDHWSLAGEKEKAVMVLSSDKRTIHVKWELCENGRDWIPWMEIVLKKQ